LDLMSVAGGGNPGNSSRGNGLVIVCHYKISSKQTYLR